MLWVGSNCVKPSDARGAADYNPAMPSPDPLILAVETSARTGSVALARGPRIDAAIRFQADYNHAAELLPTIAAVCAEAAVRPADIEQVYLSIGPGSFTGLRIAVTMARTMALAGNVRLVPVPTLLSLAQNALAFDDPPTRIGVLLDAKRGEVYAGVFELAGESYQPCAGPMVTDPVRFVEALPPPRFILGEGLRYHRAALQEVNHCPLPESLWEPRVEVVHRLGWTLACRGQFEQAARLTPLYLRLPEAEEVWRKKSGQTRAQ